MNTRKDWVIKKKNVYYVDENFFQKWTPAMAYVLGYFIADGDMVINNRGAHYINFTSTDYGVIDLIKNLLRAEQKIGIRNPNNPKWKKSYRLQIGSKQIFKDLVRLGLVQNKSKKLNFPLVSKKFLKDFVRGYFDGDGFSSFSIFRRFNRPSPGKVVFSGFVSGSKNFLRELKKQLKLNADLRGGTLYFRKGYRLTYSFHDSLKLYPFIYRRVEGIYLKRKYLHFSKALKNYGAVV